MACESVGVAFVQCDVLSFVICHLSFVIASWELICVKCEEILPKQLTINMKPTNLTNAI